MSHGREVRAYRPAHCTDHEPDETLVRGPARGLIGTRMDSLVKLQRPLTLAGGKHEERCRGMATDVAQTRRGPTTRSRASHMRLSTETKHALKTTEFWAMIVIVLGILIASSVVGQGDGSGRNDVDAFPAVRAWLYIAIVGAGYMVSRGLAKSGSREPYWADPDDASGSDGDR
jgi:hypothetical protein